MSDADRQRRLHIQNRLEELNAKHGPVDDELPDWLDHMPEAPEPPVLESRAPAKPDPPRPHQPGRPPRTADW